ncbi:MAG TPA: twin-arginine translocation signal domain-containing protein [Anaerolineae bacterium]
MSERKKRDEAQVSRRDFIKGAGLVAGSVAIGSTALIAAAPAPQAPTPTAGQATPVTLEVLDPVGPLEVTALYSKRLDTLEGKRIGYTEGTWMVGTAKPLVMDLLKKQYPTMVEVPNVPQYGTFQSMSDADIAKWMKDNQVDGMIVGNAG